LTTDSSLGGREARLVTFSYNVTIGIPLYVEINRIIVHWFPMS